MKVKGLIAVLIALCLAVQCMGCSWILMKRVPKYCDQRKEPECSGYTMPILDLSIAAVLGLAGTLILAVPGKQCGEDSSDGFMDFSCAFDRMGEQGMGILLLIAAIPYLISGATGFSWAGDCHKDRELHEAWLSGLSEKELMEVNRLKHDKRCNTLRKKFKKTSTSAEFRYYHKECREFIKKDVRSKDIQGRTKLHLAVKEGSKKKTKRLLIIGSDVNAKDKYGWTPLHYAASVDSEDIVEMLLKKGADPKIKDNEGKTPLDIAVEEGHEGVVEILKKSGRGR